MPTQKNRSSKHDEALLLEYDREIGIHPGSRTTLEMLIISHRHQRQFIMKELEHDREYRKAAIDKKVAEMYNNCDIGGIEDLRDSLVEMFDQYISAARQARGETAEESKLSDRIAEGWMSRWFPKEKDV